MTLHDLYCILHKAIPLVSLGSEVWYVDGVDGDSVKKDVILVVTGNNIEIIISEEGTKFIAHQCQKSLPSWFEMFDYSQKEPDGYYIKLKE